MIELEHGTPDLPVSAVVSPVDGGRIASLRVGGEDLLVSGEGDDHPMLWGCYPMVPWAGRIRDGRFDIDGRTVELPIDLPPHAIHGTGYLSRWTVIDSGLDHVELSTALTWPLGGRAHQHVQLTERALVLVLTVVADDRPMPVTIGWHPWFVKPVADRLRFGRMYLRDAEGIPTGLLVEPTPRPWDDCFVDPEGPLELHLASGRVVTISSDCDHWVVYDQPEHATCVEPQSGPPDAVHLGTATRLEPGELLQRTMTIAWS
jgi:aldose 1-epimerase